MHRFAVLAALAALALAASAGASLDDDISQPEPKPLSVLVGDSKTIHVLRVASVGPKGVTFKTEATLKGESDKVPFGFVALGGNVGCEDLFRADEPVLCFRRDDVALLYAGGRWAVALEQDLFHGGGDWSCLAGGPYDVIYDGPTAELREHVAAILAGRETTITARTPPTWGAAGGRLWRIKAGPGVTDFALSDESPHFVGWGTGDPDEVRQLERALRGGVPRERIAAAADLAYLGPPARPALPTLRRALGDPDAAVAFAAATAVARLDPDDEAAVKAIRDHLRRDDAGVRCAAAEALGGLGPRASSALPALLRALRDDNGFVREAAADAVGLVAASPPKAEAVDALAALLRDERAYVRTAALRSLRSFGPHAWPALPALREGLLAPHHDPGLRDFDAAAVAWLARFDPPPVDFLAEVLTDHRFQYATRRAAVQQLGALGPQARPAFPALRRVLREPQSDDGDGRGPLRLDAAEALLAVDPDGGPAVAAPALVELMEECPTEKSRAIHLLGRCGAAARPAALDLLKSLDADDYHTPDAVRSLTPLLSPEDGGLLPTLRRLLSGGFGDGLEPAEVLLRLGRQEEAAATAARRLESDLPDRCAAAARFLGEQGRGAEAAAPALRRALERADGALGARLALTLVRVRGLEGTGARACALAALGDLLDVSEGESPAVGRVRQIAFWSWGQYYAVSQEDDAVGAAVGTVLSRLDASDDPVAVLAKALDDRSPHVRLAAAIALARADPGHKDTAPALRRLLERYPHFFGFVADTLAALGPTAAPLAPQVLALTRHPGADVARAAGRVLRRIDPALAAKSWGAVGAPGAVPDDIGPLWDDLAGKDALRADLAVWRLAGAGPRAVTLVRERLRPPPAPAPERVARLIADLDSDDFDARERASAELTEDIEAAAPALRRALAADPSVELRLRIEALLADRDPTPEQRRRLRAVRVLEETGVAEGRALLKSLAQGDERFDLTKAAAAALLRLDRE
jgi:HEAT repeat protein